MKKINLTPKYLQFDIVTTVNTVEEYDEDSNVELLNKMSEKLEEKRERIKTLEAKLAEKKEEIKKSGNNEKTAKAIYTPAPTSKKAISIKMTAMNAPVPTPINIGSRITRKEFCFSCSIFWIREESGIAKILIASKMKG
jgi:hypothetical protein